MSGDDHGADGKRSSQRRIKQPALPPGPLRELKDWVYWLYQQAGAPSLDTIHRGCEHDGTAEVAGWPGRDTIHRIIAAAAVPPSQPDTVAVARVLARLARQDADEAAARTRDLWLQAQTSIPLGTPLDQVRDPFDLHVHRPIVSDETAGVPPLPPYVRRAHDDWLAAVVDHARCGQSRMAVLVAGSSAGKTRALWEALEPLRQTGRWRLWHPFDPTRPKAAVAGLDQVGPSTVVWLNETQEYLDAPDDFPEQIAAKLHSLLTDPTRAPVLVLGTLWPEHHAALTRRPGTQVTQLLDSATIRVPETFQGADLHAMTQAAEADARLASAVGQAEGGHITQYLAGAPKLLARLNDAPAASRAVIEAAMDARRMGHRNALPHALLEAAAPAYLTDLQWNGLRENWLEDALAYTSEPCKGARGPVTRIGPARIPSARRANHPSTAADGAMGEGGPTYRLADYLEQHGRHHRADQIPPPAFWTAAAARACPDDLDTLARAAEERGLLRDAAQLYKHATGYGDSHAAYKLVKLLQQVHPTDRHAAHWAATHSSLTDPVGVARLLKILRKVGAEEQVMVLLARAPATHTALTDASAIAELLSGLREVGAEEQVAALAKRAAVHVPAIALLGVARLLVSLRKAGASEQVAALAKRTAAHSAFLNLSNVTLSLDVLWQAGAGELVSVLAERAAAHTPINELFRVTGLLRQLRQVGAEEQIAVLLARDPAAHAPLTSTSGVADLLDSLQRVGANAQVAALTKRVAMQSPLPLPSDVAELVDSLRQVGAEEQAATLTGRAAACLPLTNAADVAELLDILQQVGAEEQVAALLARNPAANIPLTNAADIASLLVSLRHVGAEEQVAALLARNPAANIPLTNAADIAFLLVSLRHVGAEEQVAALAERAAANTPLSNASGAAKLLDILQQVGAEEQVAALLARNPAANIPLTNGSGVAFLLVSLRQVGAKEQVAALAERAAANIPLTHVSDVTRLMDSLRQVGAKEQVAALAERAAANIPLTHASDVTRLMDSLLRTGTGHMAGLLSMLREVGADEQATVLAERFPAAGRFDQFLWATDGKEQFRFGREPDGRPAPPWTWEQLE